MDSRLDTAVTVEQLPVPIPLDSDRRPADLSADPAPGLNTTVQEIPQPPTQTLIIDPSPQESGRQQDPTPGTTTEAPSEAGAPQVSEATQENPTPHESTLQDNETVPNNETPHVDEAPQVSEGSQQNPTPQESIPQNNETVQNSETPRGDEAPRENETDHNTEAQNSPEAVSPPENAEDNADEDADENADEHAYWVEEEEDTSVPDEAEMKEIESQAESDRSALECELSLITPHIHYI